MTCEPSHKGCPVWEPFPQRVHELWAGWTSALVPSLWSWWMKVPVAKPTYKLHPSCHGSFVNEPIGQGLSDWRQNEWVPQTSHLVCRVTSKRSSHVCPLQTSLSSLLSSFIPYKPDCLVKPVSTVPVSFYRVTLASLCRWNKQQGVLLTFLLLGGFLFITSPQDSP